MDIQNAEFQNPRLAQIYENFNQFTDDKDFWLEIIDDLSVSHVTDFGCGTGLFTTQLAELGYTLIGIEPAKPMLDIAKSKEEGKDVTWIEGDYRDLLGFNTDLVLMTSHVSQFVLESNEWIQLLENAFSCLNPGGYILFDTKNPLVKPWENYTKEKYHRIKKTLLGDVEMWIELVEVSGDYAEHQITYQFDNGETLTSNNRLIYRTREDIERNVSKAGFSVINVFGNWDKSSYTEDSPEMILLAQKP